MKSEFPIFSVHFGSLAIAIFLATAALGQQTKPGFYESLPIVPPKVDYRKLREVNETTLRDLSWDDPLAELVYSQTFLYNGHSEGLEKLPTPIWRKASLAELRRRGNEATPFLLDLYDNHPNPELRGRLLYLIGGIETIDKQPFLESARKSAHQFGRPLPRPSTFHGTIRFIGRYGTAEDLPILRKMLELDAIGSSVNYAVQDLRKRIDHPELNALIEGGMVPMRALIQVVDGKKESNEGGKEVVAVNPVEPSNSQTPAEAPGLTMKIFPWIGALVAVAIVFVVPLFARNRRHSEA